MAEAGQQQQQQQLLLLLFSCRRLRFALCRTTTFWKKKQWLDAWSRLMHNLFIRSVWFVGTPFRQKNTYSQTHKHSDKHSTRRIVALTTWTDRLVRRQSSITLGPSPDLVFIESGFLVSSHCLLGDGFLDHSP